MNARIPIEITPLGRAEMARASRAERLPKLFGDKPVRAALKALVAAYPETPDQLRSPVIKAVATIFRTHEKRIDAARLVRVLEEHDCETLVEAARAYQKLVGGNTAAALVHSLIRAYDKGLGERARLTAPERAAA